MSSSFTNFTPNLQGLPNVDKTHMKEEMIHYNSSHEVDVNLPTPMLKPQSPINEPTTHSNHVSLQSQSLPLSDSCNTNVGQASIPPQSINQSQTATLIS
ncbi:hypothetical protein Tco_1219937 [Tanacetum coccineum]